ncbi:MAG: hypothetical protein F4X80_07750 [Chloroflexi bacterium]|nr:hypothetical protein [Chloroflexota bacterium]
MAGARMTTLRRAVRTSTLSLALLVLAFLLTACPSGSGGDGGGSTPTPSATPGPTLNGEAPVVTLKLDMRDIAYGAEELRAPAGAVFAIEFRNRGVIEHDFTIDEFAGDASEFALDNDEYDVHVLLDRGESATLLLRVPQAGTIEFYCTIPGHREVGMEGVLVVE